jgi:hypothetical protein
MRSLFGGVALIAMFLAYHLHWIRQRHDVLHRKATALDYVVQVANENNEITLLFPVLEDPPPTSTRAPLFLRVFGEPGYYELCFAFDGTLLDWRRRELSDEEQAFLGQAQRLFPEAKISGDGIAKDEESPQPIGNLSASQ